MPRAAPVTTAFCPLRSIAFMVPRVARAIAPGSSRRRAALGLHLALARGRVLGELVGRPDRSAHELAAAVGTAPGERALGASLAERAFERADHRVACRGRQVP